MDLSHLGSDHLRGTCKNFGILCFGQFILDKVKITRFAFFLREAACASHVWGISKCSLDQFGAENAVDLCPGLCSTSRFGQVVGNTCICHLASKRSTLLLDSQQVVVGAASKEGFAEDLIAARNLVLYGLFLSVVVFCSG